MKLEKGTHVRIRLREGHILGGLTGVVTNLNPAGEGLYTVKLNGRPNSSFWFYAEELEPYDYVAEEKEDIKTALNRIVTAARNFPLTAQGEYILVDNNATSFMNEAHGALIGLLENRKGKNND